MSKKITEEGKDLEESIQFVEAELESLEEEMTLFRKEHPPMPKRTIFVRMRVSRLKKDLEKLREKLVSLREHEKWLNRMKQNGPNR